MRLTDKTKGCGKDNIEVLIGKAAERSDASTKISRNDSIRACGVGDERR